jgi:5''-nucleotidase/2'',3''-cyclic phosphodiesterase and related esterases
MRNLGSNNLLGMLCVTGLLIFSGCSSTYQLKSIQASKIEMTPTYEVNPDKAVVAALAPYKSKVDSIMSPVIGTSAMDMTSKSPESLLSNLVADVLWSYANSLPGESIDFSVINLGGLRSNLPKGVITYGTIYEILPFENTLCVLSLKGSDVKSLFADIAKVGGQGISHANLVISKSYNADLLDATIGGKAIDDNKIYRVATIDYLAEGNDGLISFQKSENKVYPKGAILRNIFLEYVKAKAAKGEMVSSALDGRISIKK